MQWTIFIVPRVQTHWKKSDGIITCKSMHNTFVLKNLENITTNKMHDYKAVKSVKEDHQY